MSRYDLAAGLDVSASPCLRDVLRDILGVDQSKVHVAAERSQKLLCLP